MPMMSSFGVVNNVAIPGVVLMFPSSYRKPRKSRLMRVAQGVCQSPKRLAFGTVDSLIRTLWEIFVEHGRGSEWQSVLNIGNPASDWSVKRYLADVREEQLKARVVPRQAEPFLLEDLMKISRHIHFQLMHSANLTPSQIYILARDQTMIKAFFFFLREIAQPICWV